MMPTIPLDPSGLRFFCNGDLLAGSPQEKKAHQNQPLASFPIPQNAMAPPLHLLNALPLFHLHYYLYRPRRVLGSRSDCVSDMAIPRLAVFPVPAASKTGSPDALLTASNTGALKSKNRLAQRLPGIIITAEVFGNYLKKFSRIRIYTTYACKRNIEMTPLCKIEVTHPGVLGSREVHRGGVVDEQAGVQPP